MWEEYVVKTVLTIKHLVGLQLHGTGINLSCPSTRDADIDILIEEHALRRTDITEINRTVPRLIPVHGVIATVTGNTVLPYDVNTPHRVSKITFVANDRDDGYGILIICLDKATSNGYAGQEAILEQSEHVVRGARNGKPTIFAFLTTTINRGRHRAISRIHQRGTFRNVHMECKRTVKQLAARADNWCIKSRAGKDCRLVRCPWSRGGRPPPVIDTITLAGVCCTTHCFRIYLTGNELSALITEVDGTTVTIKLKRCLITLNLVRTQPNDQIAFGRNTTNVVGHLPKHEVILIVAEIHACEADDRCIGII